MCDLLFFGDDELAPAFQELDTSINKMKKLMFQKEIEAKEEQLMKNLHVPAESSSENEEESPDAKHRMSDHHKHNLHEKFKSAAVAVMMIESVRGLGKKTKSQRKLFKAKCVIKPKIPPHFV